MGKAIGSVVGGSGWSRRGSSHRQPSFTWDWSGLGGDVWSRGWRVGWRGSRGSGGGGAGENFFHWGSQEREIFFFDSNSPESGCWLRGLRGTRANQKGAGGGL